ncbi:MAG: endonuclease/exonuclease/phosphatase family protein [Planctomycetota bacterium]
MATRRNVGPIRRTLLVTAFALLPLLTGCSVLRFQVGGDYAASPAFQTPPAPWPAARTLRVVTFNIKDMYWLSDHRAERMAGIADSLAGLRPDVVCLQEGFVAGDVAVIGDALAAIGVAHAADFPSGVVGSGLWTFSRFPIRETFFHRYTRNGSPWDTVGGDWWAGKGVALARLELASGVLLDVYNTHMICNRGGPELRAHRDVQAREFAAFVTSASPDHVPALLLGDFNCGPGGKQFAHLDDVLRWQPMLQHRRWGYDHVYARSPGGRYGFTPLDEVVISGEVGVDAETGERVAFSDHDGLLAELRIERK